MSAEFSVPGMWWNRGHPLAIASRTRWQERAFQRFDKVEWGIVEPPCFADHGIHGMFLFLLVDTTIRKLFVFWIPDSISCAAMSTAMLHAENFGVGVVSIFLVLNTKNPQNHVDFFQQI